jgi:hypothetical protein
MNVIMYVSNSKKKCYNCFFNKFLILSKILRMKNIKDILYCNLNELMLI